MADTGTHSRLRGRIKAALKAMPGVMVTNGDPSDGALDLILCVDGHYAELDIKTGNATFSAAQLVRCRQVEQSRGSAGVTSSRRGATDFVTQLREDVRDDH